RVPLSGLAISGALMCAFAGWTVIVRPWEAPPAVDWNLAGFMKDYDEHHEIVRRIGIFFTQLGGGESLNTLAVLRTRGPLLLRQWRLALVWAVATAVGGLLNLALKEQIDRQRPPMPDKVVTERNESYPSGHAMGSTIGFGMIAYAALLVV